MPPRGRPRGSGNKRTSKPPPPPAPNLHPRQLLPVDRPEIPASKILEVLEHIRAEPTNERFLSKWLPDTLWTCLLNLYKGLMGQELPCPEPLNKALALDKTYRDGLRKSQNETGIFSEVYCSRQFYCILPWKEQCEEQAEQPLEENSGVNVEKPEPLYQIKRPLFCHSWMKETLEVAESLSFGLPPLVVQPLVVPPKKSKSEPSKKRPLPEEILHVSYWESKEAENLFRPKPEDANVEATLKRRIELLRQANLVKDGWKKVILGGDPNDLCTEGDRFNIRLKSQILCLSYSIALERMGKMSFRECVVEAVDILNRAGNAKATAYTSVFHWNRTFCAQEAWDHPRPTGSDNTKGAPRLFKLYPQLIEPFRTFMLEHVHSLSVDLGIQYLSQNLLPPFVQEMRNKEESKEEFADIHAVEDLCQHHHLKTGISKAMVTCMFAYLGFQFCDKANGYQVEGKKRGYWVHLPWKDATVKESESV